jgi:hypothetical protein
VDLVGPNHQSTGIFKEFDKAGKTAQNETYAKSEVTTGKPNHGLHP